jgi:hypothetical protein
MIGDYESERRAEGRCLLSPGPPSDDLHLRRALTDIVDVNRAEGKVVNLGKDSDTEQGHQLLQ